MTGQTRPNGGAEPASPETARLIAAAAEIAGLSPVEAAGPAASASIAQFVGVYRAWILRERGMADAPERWAELGRLMLHSMAAASTVLEAAQIIGRFAQPLYGERLSAELRDEGEAMALIFHEPLGAGPEGLIRALWPLSFTLCQLEFLAGGRLAGVCGRVRNPACLPPGVAGLLFSRRLGYEAQEAALVIPKHELARAVVARAADIPGFFAQVVRATLALDRQAVDAGVLVARLLRADKLRNPGTPADLPALAARLGCSPATLRRRLAAEGAGFRQIRDEVFDALAKSWLADGELTVEQIAERLGYSDGFAFRRAFRRRNGEAPLAFRRRARARAEACEAQAAAESNSPGAGRSA